MSDLRTELKQRQPFRSLGHEAHLSILRTAAELEHAFEAALKPHGITATQYNVLRMLRRVPDVTRLLDRMEDMLLIVRKRGSDDRRFVTARITPAGLKMLAVLDPVADELTDTLMGPLGDARLRTLVDLLGRVRSRT